MMHFTKGRFTVRPTANAQDRAAVLSLRARCFGVQGGIEDPFDAAATQVMIEDCQNHELVGTFRMALMSGAQVCDSYSAQFYGLEALTSYPAPLLELGRFCVSPAHSDPEILRIAWAGLTSFVDANDVCFLFGCSSFEGQDHERYLDAFALLRARHLAPAHLAPRVKSPDVFEYAAELSWKPDLAKANAAMPPLLRTYLMMGGWVSDHAVVDPVMNTLHVFTGLDIATIPPARKKLLRALV